MGLLIYPVVTDLRNDSSVDHYAFSDDSTHGPARSGQEAINGLAAILREYGTAKDDAGFIAAADSVEALEADAVERGEGTVEVVGVVRYTFRVDEDEDAGEQ